MTNANRFLADGEREQVALAIADLEKKTSAELLCAVSTESGRYDRAESIIGLVTAILVLAKTNVLWVYLTDWQAGPNGWLPPYGLPFLFQVLAVVIGYAAGSVIASYFHPLRRLFVLSKEREREVERAAAFLFASQRLHTTRSAGGILLYISLFEHRVVVLADEGAMRALDQATLDRVCATVLQKIKAGNRLGAILAAIEILQPPLTAALPIGEGDTDELPNGLVCIHPRP